MTIHSSIEPRSRAALDGPVSSSTASTVTTTSPSVQKRQYSLPLTSQPIPSKMEVPPSTQASLASADLLREFVTAYKELESYKDGASIPLTGASLTLPAVHAVARYPELVASSLDPSSTSFTIDSSPERVAFVERSRRIIDEKLSANKSIYGVSTGFGGSADTRTDDYASLGFALLQHQHAGILPSSLSSLSTPPSGPTPLPLSDPLNTLSMPVPWVRAALVIRLNSLLRGHSAISFPLLKSMSALLAHGITPVVPLRGSISASGDLSPLSYIAGALIGEPGIFCYSPDPKAPGTVRIVPAPQALAEHGLTPRTLQPKEHLGILNGTAFSCALATLCVEESRQMMLLGVVTTAMSTEALRGSVGSFGEFVQRIRPHPGQVETGELLCHLLETSKLVQEHGEHSEEEKTIADDAGVLRQDRYPLRTAPQWLGPQIEEVQRAARVVQIECNSTTDNPLIDPDTETVHHGGNFQAMALTSVLESLRLALHHVGKLLFTQATELQNPAMNGGLSGNLAATDPSVNFAGKGIDIAQAAYVSELTYLANPVSTGVQSAEMHNQAVNSLALISARYTVQALDVLQLLTASSLYILCQALDLRALQIQLHDAISEHVSAALRPHIPTEHSTSANASAFAKLEREISSAVKSAHDAAATMDQASRAERAAQAVAPVLVSFTRTYPVLGGVLLPSLPSIESALSASIAATHATLTSLFLRGTTDTKSPYYMPAKPLLGRTVALYEFIRGELGVRMHGLENLLRFDNGLGKGEGAAPGGRTIGGEVTLIYEAIRDGRVRKILAGMFDL